MEPEWSQRQESVAYHEAGHRVIAFLENAPPRDVELFWNAEEKRWRGRVPGYSRRLLGNSALIQIAYAGPWAEINYQACLQFPGDILDIVPEPSSLIAFAQNPSSNSRLSNHCLTVQTSILARTLEIDTNAFSTDAEIAFELAGGDHGAVKDYLLRVRDMVVKPQVWSAIRALAYELLQRLGDRKKLTVCADEVEVFIRSKSSRE